MEFSHAGFCRKRQPWDFFGLGPDVRQGADVVVTGEEFVLLELLDRLLEFKAQRESWRLAFARARSEGALEDIPGLVYRRDEGEGPIRELMNTGVQRLVRDLDELPLPLEALGMFERPHRMSSLGACPNICSCSRMAAGFRWALAFSASAQPCARTIPLNRPRRCRSGARSSKDCGSSISVATRPTLSPGLATETCEFLART